MKNDTKKPVLANGKKTIWVLYSLEDFQKDDMLPFRKRWSQYSLDRMHRSDNRWPDDTYLGSCSRAAISRTIPSVCVSSTFLLRRKVRGWTNRRRSSKQQADCHWSVEILATYLGGQRNTFSFSEYLFAALICHPLIGNWWNSESLCITALPALGKINRNLESVFIVAD
jgi:hypothetical protein